MPEFRLRLWAEQTLFDCRDFVVTADTLEAATKQLLLLHDAVEFGDDKVTLPDNIEAGTNEMIALDPEEVVDGTVGVTLLNDDDERLRDLVNVPTCCVRLGEPLDIDLDDGDSPPANEKS